MIFMAAFSIASFGYWMKWISFIARRLFYTETSFYVNSISVNLIYILSFKKITFM